MPMVAPCRVMATGVFDSRKRDRFSRNSRIPTLVACMALPRCVHNDTTILGGHCFGGHPSVAVRTGSPFGFGLVLHWDRSQEAFVTGELQRSDRVWLFLSAFNSCALREAGLTSRFMRAKAVMSPYAASDRGRTARSMSLSLVCRATRSS